MSILLAGVLAGFAGGLLTGGRWRNLERSQLKAWYVLIAALAAQALLPAMTALGRLGIGLLISAVWLSLAAISAIVCLINWRAAGMALAALGIAANALCVAVNGGMPVSVANVPADPSLVREMLDASWLHQPLTDSTSLPWLADVVPIPGPSGLRGMASLGDLLLAIGVAQFVFAATRGAAASRGSIGS